jgi:hypothetical protein
MRRLGGAQPRSPRSASKAPAVLVHQQGLNEELAKQIVEVISKIIRGLGKRLVHGAHLEHQFVFHLGGHECRLIIRALLQMSALWPRLIAHRLGQLHDTF